MHTCLQVGCQRLFQAEANRNGAVNQPQMGDKWMKHDLLHSHQHECNRSNLRRRGVQGELGGGGGLPRQRQPLPWQQR